MLPLLKKLFGYNDGRAAKTFESTKKLSNLQNDIAAKKKELDSMEYGILLEQKDEVFISLNDFLDLMEIDALSMDVLLKRCKHISELDKKSAVTELYSVVEDDHVVLCPNPKECERHKDTVMTKIRIATIRGVRE